MRATLTGRTATLAAACGSTAVVTGLLLAKLEPQWSIAGILGFLGVAIVYYDYRLGLVFLTFLLPWSYSSLLPQTHGFNLINFLIAATSTSLVLRRMLRREESVWLPAVMVWCYLVPFVLAVSLAFPHLAQGLANDPLDSNLKPLQFLIQHGIKPFFIILYALMLANAIRDSKRPELLIISFAVAAILPSILIIQQVLSGADVTNRSSAQGFMAEFGLHPNSYGILFTSCLGPLLFISTGGGQRYLRTIAAIAFFIVSIGIILTASRGAAMAYSIVIVLWLLKRRKLGYLMISVVACLTLLALMPDQVAERLIIGLDTIGEADFAARGDRLTMGRGYVWSTLAPDIWLSPWFGHGIGSTAWNTATTRGINSAGHPHNWYLGILLDMGLLGFCAMMYLFYRLSRKFISLGVESSLPIVIQNFFSGAFVSLVALLAYYVTNGFWWPEPEQTFFWFTLGFAFAYWTRPQLSGLGPSSGRSIRREVAMNGPAPTHGVRR